MASLDWEPLSICDICRCAVPSAQNWSIPQKHTKICHHCLGQHTSNSGIDPVGHQTWTCPKHPERPVEFFCRSCDKAICQRCETTQHRAQDHDVEDIEDVVERKRATCGDQLKQVTTKVEELQLMEETVEEQATNVEDHFREVERHIRAATNEEIQITCQEKERKQQRIKSRFDKELKRLQKQCKDEIAQVDQQAGKTEGDIKVRSGIILTELSEVNDRFYAALQSIRASVREFMSGLRSMQKKLNKILSSGSQGIVESYNHVKELKQQSEKTDKKTAEATSATQVAKLTRRVRFVRRHENHLIGQLVGLDRSWELKQKVEIPEYVKDPLFITAFDDHLMAVLDNDSSQLYVTSLATQRTRLFISSTGTDAKVWDCAPLDRNTVVCGHYNSKCISLYSSDGRRIDTMPMPARFQGFVAVTKEGLILLSTQDDSSMIYFIDPKVRKLLGEMAFPGKTICGIQTTSSGHIVVRTGKAEFIVVDSAGKTQMTLHNPEWTGAECGVDRNRNMLFVAHWKKDDTAINVTITALDGQVEENNIVSFEMSSRSKNLSRCAITSMGSLVVCDGNYLLEYQRMINLKHLEETLCQDIQATSA